ncbi:MAG: tetratricopeptide repeat protein [Desulfatitalea sp.]|nr:tetratricopeptide repeat protein [Desulfatitalea sp.]NNK01708.1 tetratricopeptide repeat protein [Desulfatitalea sp.]
MTMEVSAQDLLNESLFASLNTQSTELTTLANQALGNGIDRYMNEDYEEAAREFRRAIGLDPYSDYSVDAGKYLAMTHLKQGDTDKAIDAYHQILQLHPDRDDIQVAVGNLHFGEGRTGEAITAYEKAVRIYDNTTNRFSLGQAYLNAGRLDDAANQFEKVIRMDRQSANGYLGLGQVYSAQQKSTDAITQFELAIQKKKDLWAAYAEMGYAYADAGQLDAAEEIKSLLEYKDEGLADTLNAYINKNTSPKIITVWGDSTFSYHLPSKTKVADLGEYLNTAGSSQSFSMIFQFSKEMDSESVENPLNWEIKRASANGTGANYNFGLPLPETETRIMPIPTDVYYDEKTFSATVRFSIHQNATADATIHPSHLEFSFKGEDADGNRMDPKYDQFMGFSGKF